MRRCWSGWRGEVAVGPWRLPLILDKGLVRPDGAQVAVIEALPEHAEALIALAEAALGQRLEAWRLDGLPVPRLAESREVWGHATPVHVRVEGKPPGLEIGVRTAWDEEHTYGLRYRGWCLVEICESVPGV